MKSSTPASAAMAAAVRRLSPVTITVRMPMRRSAAKRSRMPGLTMSFSSMAPSRRPSLATASGVRALAGDAVHRLRERRRQVRARRALARLSTAPLR